MQPQSVIVYVVCNQGSFLCMRPVNDRERRRYNITPFVIGWAHTQNDSHVMRSAHWSKGIFKTKFSLFAAHAPKSVIWIPFGGASDKHFNKIKTFLFQRPSIEDIVPI